MVKDLPLFVPLGLVTNTVPEVVPAATTAVIVVEVTPVTVQAVPFMLTVVEPVVAKLVPVIAIVELTQTGLGDTLGNRNIG